MITPWRRWSGPRGERDGIGSVVLDRVCSCPQPVGCACRHHGGSVRRRVPARLAREVKPRGESPGIEENEDDDDENPEPRARGEHALWF